MPPQAKQYITCIYRQIDMTVATDSGDGERGRDGGDEGRGDGGDEGEGRAGAGQREGKYNVIRNNHAVISLAARWLGATRELCRVVPSILRHPSGSLVPECSPSLAFPSGPRGIEHLAPRCAFHG